MRDYIKEKLPEISEVAAPGACLDDNILPFSGEINIFVGLLISRLRIINNKYSKVKNSKKIISDTYISKLSGHVINKNYKIYDLLD